MSISCPSKLSMNSIYKLICEMCLRILECRFSITFMLLQYFSSRQSRYSSVGRAFDCISSHIYRIVAGSIAASELFFICFLKFSNSMEMSMDSHRRAPFETKCTLVIVVSSTSTVHIETFIRPFNAKL